MQSLLFVVSGTRRWKANRNSLVVLGAVVALIAVPTGTGAKPVRTVIPTPEPFVIPAGFGCRFDVRSAPVGSQAITEFDDGRVVTIGNADITLTNLETGASYVQHSNYHGTDTLDPGANTRHLVVNGSIFIQFFEGDAGPFGEVGENGALFAFVGTLSITLDLNNEAYSAFSYHGTATDLCALLAA